MPSKTPTRCVFISDIHLTESRPELTHALTRFLDSLKGHCDQLYLLGDIFEAWIGDDATSALADNIKTHLATLAETGCELFFVHGNRDFLVGEQFCNDINATLLPDVSIITLPHQAQAVILHGDTLCTEDTSYLEFRKLVRTPQWQHMFLSKSIDERIALAHQARQQSKEKSNEITDASYEAVDELFELSGVSIMIHGHTHRPEIHTTRKGNTRYVLSDWEKSFQYLDCDTSGCRLIKQTIDSTDHISKVD